VGFEIAPPSAPEATPRDVFLVVASLGIRARVATYTLPEVCTSVLTARRRAGTRFGTPIAVAVQCSNEANDVASVRVDEGSLVVTTNGAEKRYAIAPGAKVAFGSLPLPTRECAKAPQRLVTVAIRRHIKKTEPALHEIWVESSALKLQRQVGGMFHELGCSSSREGGGLTVTCVTKIGPSKTYELGTDGDWLVIDGETPSRALLPCNARVVFDGYSDRALPAIAAP
jgi:hypothetical protein